MKNVLRLGFAFTIVAGLTLVNPSGAMAAGSACATAGSPAETVCVATQGPGVRVNTSTTTYYRSHGGLSVCNFRAWNSGAISAQSAWSKTSPIQYRCLYGQATVSMTINRTVYDPSFYYGQFYANGAWEPAIPRILLTS